MNLYDITVIESADGGYVGFLTDKPGVMSFGKTKEELKIMLRDALAVMTIYENSNKINR